MNRTAATILLAGVCWGLVGCASSSISDEKGNPVPEHNRSLYAFALQNDGFDLMQQGKYEEALKKFKETNKVQPGNATVYNMIGLCHLNLGQYDQALLSFNDALSYAPSFTDARNNRGAVYLAIGQYALAEVDFTAVLADSTYPHRAQAFYNLGMSYLQRGNLASAQENFQNAAFAQVPVWYAYLQLSDIAMEQEQPDKAVSWLEEGKLKFPDQLELSMKLGTVLMELGRDDEAREHLQAVVDGDPRSELAAQARTLLALGAN